MDATTTSTVGSGDSGGPSGSAARRPAPLRGFAAVKAVARGTTSGRLKGGRLWLLVILLGLPLVVQLLILIFGEGRGSSFASFIETVDAAYFQFGLPLALIFLGTAALGDEWEGGTAFYLLGLPLPRWSIVVGRWLVSAARALMLVVPALAALFVLALAPHDGALAHYFPVFLWVLLGAVLMSLGYGAIFLCLGLALRRPVLAAFIVYMVERFVSVLPRGLAKLALSYHVRNLLYLGTGEFELQLAAATNIESTPAWQSVLSICIYMAASLFLATWLLRRKEFTGSIAPPESSGGTG